MSSKIATGLEAMFRLRGYADAVVHLTPLPDWCEVLHAMTPTVIVCVSHVSLKKSMAKRIVETMQHGSPKRIMVADGGSRQAIDFLLQHGIEFVSLTLVLFDRSAHSLVPAYRVLPAPEREALLRQYSTPVSDWPKIYRSDPQVIYLGAAVGDIVHNISDNIYRTVIDPL